LTADQSSVLSLGRQSSPFQELYRIYARNMMEPISSAKSDCGCHRSSRMSAARCRKNGLRQTIDDLHQLHVDT